MKPSLPEFARAIQTPSGTDLSWWRFFETLTQNSIDRTALRAVAELPASPTNEEIATAFNSLLAVLKA